ncbi:MAG TPA: WG repeat-containing protein [Pyrinomonadaceae bacterium]|nr:WG repeat-containing protein [Pyrinomonadaceae bacterium]
MRRAGVLTFLSVLILASVGTALGQGRKAEDKSSTPLFPFVSRLDGKVGFIDETGRIVIKAQFDHYPIKRNPAESLSSTLRNYRFSEHYAKVLVDSLIGYIDETGEVRIKPQFAEAGDFSEGLAWVLKDGKYGFINKAGEFRINPTYDGAGNFSEGLAWVRVNDKYGFINSDNKVVIEPQFEAAGDFSEKLARVMIGGKYGFINKDNERVIKPQFEDAGDFSKGRARVRVDGQYGYINEKGEQVIDAKFISAGDFSEGMAAVQDASDYKYINKHGALALDPKSNVTRAFEFSNGLAAVILSSNLIDEPATKIGAVSTAKGAIDNSNTTPTEGRLVYEYGYINKKGELIFQGSMIFGMGLPSGPGPAMVTYFETKKVQINVRTNPRVVKLYAVPILKWMSDPNLINSQEKLLRCSECLNTNTPYVGEIYSDNYIIVFELDGKKSSPIRRNINRVETRPRSVCVDLAAQPVRELTDCAELDTHR